MREQPSRLEQKNHALITVTCVSDIVAFHAAYTSGWSGPINTHDKAAIVHGTGRMTSNCTRVYNANVNYVIGNFIRAMLGTPRCPNSIRSCVIQCKLNWKFRNLYWKFRRFGLHKRKFHTSQVFCAIHGVYGLSMKWHEHRQWHAGVIIASYSSQKNFYGHSQLKCIASPAWHTCVRCRAYAFYIRIESDASLVQGKKWKATQVQSHL